MPSSAPATRAMTFLVSRPREESYRQPPGWGVGAALALGFVLASGRLCLAFLMLALLVQQSVLNQSPESAYFAQTLQTWEQGRFIRFHGLVQWLGWLWPYAALVFALTRLGRERQSER